LKEGRKEGRMDGWREGGMDGWMEGRMDGGEGFSNRRIESE
jgi:hypothetical protein